MNKSIKELIQRLKEPDYQYCGCELCKSEADLAISALEKQIPKKPAETFTDGAFKRPYNICPVCESYVNRVYHRENCGKCSQKLDWSVGE